MINTKKDINDIPLVSIFEQAENVKAVSFDLFDTLFARPLIDPEDIFDMIGEKFGIPDFRAHRREAQRRAFARMHEEQRGEITLDGIYDFLDGLSVPAPTLKQAEYELELALTLPNPEMIAIFKSLVATDRQVVITSDMYLPAAFFHDLLEKHGLPQVPIFISSERNATKRDHGELFALVAQELCLRPEHILHVGDNPVSDVQRAREAGFSAFHYLANWLPRPLGRSSASTSLAGAILKAHSSQISAGSFLELGFRHGGPAAVGFLHWIRQRAIAEGIDLLLFISRDGYSLERLAQLEGAESLPRFTYFKGSRTAFTLASINQGNFDHHLNFLLSGAHGLSPFEVFERIGVTPPAQHVLDDLGLGDSITLTDGNMPKMRQLLSARRWDILSVCRRNRRGLFRYLTELGVKDGTRLGLVDIGWNGTTQDALVQALDGLIDVNVTGYYFCLTDLPECLHRRERLQMQALVSTPHVSVDVLQKIYANRVLAELFFSAPHDAVIGYDDGPDGKVKVIEDHGRGPVTDTREAIIGIVEGMEAFSIAFNDLCRSAKFEPNPLDTAWPFINFLTDSQRDATLLADVQNFDAWGSTVNRVLRAKDYS